jgi:small conductance mechanosensitive channel
VLSTIAHIAAQDSWWHRHQDVVVALLILLGGALAIVTIDRVLVRRGARLARTVTGVGALSRDAATRLRFARRFLEALLIALTIAAALSQIDALDGLGRALLASSAITAAVVGFAARQTLANGIAGLLLAVVQPLRIGDSVTFEGETGTVEDVGLTYTWLRTGADARILIPNERLAAGLLRNDSIRSPTVATEVSVWLAADADTDTALATIAGLEAQGRLAEITQDGIRLLVMGEPGPPSERLAREGDLRAAALAALRAAGVR